MFNWQSLLQNLWEVKYDRQRYLAELEKEAFVHQRNTQLAIGAIVKLAKEFDKNIVLRKGKFEGSYYE